VHCIPKLCTAALLLFPLAFAGRDRSIAGLEGLLGVEINWPSFLTVLKIFIDGSLQGSRVSRRLIQPFSLPIHLLLDVRKEFYVLSFRANFARNRESTLLFFYLRWESRTGDGRDSETGVPFSTFTLLTNKALLMSMQRIEIGTVGIRDRAHYR
jgi:hypothetical protein